MIEFLAAVARAALTDSKEPLRWPGHGDVIDAALRHGLLAQLERVAPSIEGMPEEARARLRELSQNRTRRALVMAAQLRTVVDALRAANVDVLPVKGPVLAATAYGHPAARGAVSDLDLVVRRRDFDRAIDTIATRGYERVEWYLDEHDSWDREAHIFPAAGTEGALIELHSEMPGGFDAVLARSEERPFLGTGVPVAAAEDTLLYLCIHGSQHMWSRLQWVCDVAAQILANPRLDWAAVAQRASAIDARRALALGLHLSKAMLAVGPGGDVPKWLARLARRRMQTADPSRLMLALYDLVRRETARERRAWLLTLIKPNALDRAWVRLPRGLSWLYVVVRPLRLLTK